MLPVSVGLRRLRDGIRAAEEPAEFAPVGEQVLAEVAAGLQLSPELQEWYRLGGPKEVELSWFVEWLTLYAPEELTEMQDGYRWQLTRKGRVADPFWQPQWVVIGDWHGDPAIAHVDRPGTPVSRAFHGEGEWRPFLVAPDLGSFLAAVGIWLEVCEGKYEGDTLDDDSLVKPEVMAELDARLSDVLEPEYRQYWVKPL